MRIYNLFSKLPKLYYICGKIYPKHLSVMTRIAALLLLSILSLLPATAEVGQVAFRHYTTDNGLPSNCVRALLQDQRGFIWFGTDGGITRFDGIRFKKFSLLGVQPDRQEDEFVSSLFEHQGRIWVGLDRRLLIFDPVTERASAPNLKYAPGSKARIDAPVRHMAADTGGNLWVAVNGRGVFRINTKTMATRHYPLPQLANTPGIVYVDSRGDIWVAGSYGSGVLMKYDRGSNRFNPFRLYTQDGAVKATSVSITEDSAHRMWIGMWDGTVARFDPFTGNTEILLRPDDRNGLYHIHSIEQWSDHTFLIGSDGGLTAYDTSDGTTTLLRETNSNLESMADRFVYPLLRDREHGLWIGTFYGGANYIPPQLKMFETGRHSRLENSVCGNVISAMTEDQQGNVWIATDDGGVCCRQSVTGQYRKLNLPPEVNNVHALCFDGPELWIGTYSQGVFAYNTATGAMRHFTGGDGRPGSLPDNSSYAIHRDRSGNIWVATMTGISLYNRSDNTFRTLRTLGATTTDIDEDREGNLWFSTQGEGLLRYNPATRRWSSYRYSTRPGALPHNHVNCTHIDSGNNMWVATHGGLTRYNPRSNRFEKVDIPLPSREVMSIVEHQGVLWLGTANGLVRHVRGGETTLFTTGDGLASNQFTVNSAFKTSGGKIYAGSVGGFTAFYPHNIRTNLYEVPIVFTGLDIINREVKVGDKPLTESLNTLERLTLSHRDYLITISFAPLSYANPQKNRILYKLEGFDKDWIPAGPDWKATYSNLPPGDYTLLVRGSNNDNAWNRNVRSLPIRVLPPWYLSVPMKILYTLLILAAIFAGGWFVLRRNRRRHQAELATISHNKEKEVFQAKLSFFTMIAHEIRTPVSLIIGPMERIMKDAADLPAAVRDNLNVINRNSQRLLVLVNQLLDFKKVEQNALAVRFRPTNIAMLMTSVAERFEPSLAQKGVRLEVIYPPENFTADIDAEAVTKLLSNLLNNARKFTSSLVTLRCTVGEDTFSLAVTDDGVGISKGNLRKIFSPFFQVRGNGGDSAGGTGLGLSIVKNVVDSHHGRIEVDSTPGRGSTFTATFPLTQRVQDAAPDAIEPADADAGTHAPEHSGYDTPGADRPVMLIVDDNEEMLLFIAGNFNTRYDVVTATDGRDALAKLQSYNVSVIVSDWMMPGMSGVELCDAVRRNPQYSHIPFIMLTAKTDNFSKIEGFRCGADAYIEKPFSIEYLETRIHNLLDMRELLRQKFSSAPLEPISTLATNPVENEFLTRLNDLIESNLSNPELSVDFIASQLGISRTSLYAKIKTLADVTPNELIQLTRLKKAAKLLAENSYRVNEVCYMVGFNSPSYFAKCFQKQFGLKPAEFAMTATS